MSTEINAPDFECEGYVAQLSNLETVRDMQVGLSRLREKANLYLRRHRAEAYADFTDRTARSVLFPGFMRSVRGLAGLVYRRDLTLNDVPTKIIPHLDVIDGQTHVDVFTRQVLEDALIAGHSFILVDAPIRPKGDLTLKDEELHGLRPYWVHVKKDNVISWRVNRTGLADELERVVIRERTLEPAGEFGEKAVTRYRELRLRRGGVQWRLHERVSDHWKVVGKGVIANVSSIPLIPIYSGRTGFFESIPPLMDLANLNISHYRVQADHLTALHKASVPILTITGIKDASRVDVGPNVCLTLPEGASANYTEHSGPALNATRLQLVDLEKLMAISGMSMLQHETRAAETAEAKRIDKAEQDSALSVTARSLEDGLESAFAFHAQMLRTDPTVSVAVNRDFDRLTLDEREIAAYSGLVSNGQLSLDTLWSILAEGGALPDGFDADLERAHLEADFINIPEAD